MTSSSNPNSTILGEGHSTMRPPLFNGSNYSYWRIRMKQFIQANNYKVWRIIIIEPFIPMKRVKGVIIPKEENKLEVTHERTSRAKESKISLLTLNYELFKEKPE
ncbi:hypothetical protein V6Z12_D12G097000 [Gossypium hirsutum]